MPSRCRFLIILVERKAKLARILEEKERQAQAEIEARKRKEEEQNRLEEERRRKQIANLNEAESNEAPLQRRLNIPFVFRYFFFPLFSS